LKASHKLPLLLRALELARSAYYCHGANTDIAAKYHAEKKLIKQIYHEHKGRYGYPRIMFSLRTHGNWLNHKTVQRLMKQLGLKSTVQPKRYNSYHGDPGISVPNVLNREFEATQPNQKWVTDVTEFNVHGQKVYLSPVLDLYKREVVSYCVSKSVRLPLVTDMLTKAIKTLLKDEKPMLHSDQGWHYRTHALQAILAKNNIPQSMSRKGNCLDNAVAENFFGILKTEMYHGHDFKNADALIKAIKEYIDYYNHKRIKLKLKGLSPVDYRNQALICT
jgi:putative transposase